ncbi:hypothetical protein KFK09_024548 [Dendrobium nobile]|uniref:Retrovirus-related Pol polyprotein from transposon TNT 1-94 n=1 Tax=Dendrobium nobile TaxID=94219 RepID=A0A8T3AED4_DENNO|nr:hypothetical protein KFK09_024548 [Dendrobium nobile]
MAPSIYVLTITKSALDLHAYADLDWAANLVDRKSIFGFCTFLGSNLLSWLVKKQLNIVRSSTEVEYHALAVVASDIMWLHRLLHEFKLSITTPTQVYCDNISAIALANNPFFHARTKHIEFNYHFIRDCIKDQQISIHHISSKDLPADIFTKTLPITRFLQLKHK